MASSSLSASHWLGQSRIMSRRKGLSNELGENNCFLNVIIQSLWHLRSCRVLISTGDHALHHRFGGRPASAGASASSQSVTHPQCSNDNGNGSGVCLLCELEQIFILYQFAEEPVLEVDRVRLALGSMFALGAMNDATETLEAILDALHWDTFHRMLSLRRGREVRSKDELSQSTVEDASAIVCEPLCIAHLLFQMNLMELRSCALCGETSEPLMNTDFLYRVYAQELLSFAKGKTLEDVLRLEAQGGCIAPECAPSCDACNKGKMQLGRWILQLPMVFAMSIIWSSDMVEKRDVKAWMELLSAQNARAKRGSDDQQALDLGRIFKMDETTHAAASREYTFRGMVCYYGRHYVGFFKSRSVENGVSGERWFLFDDTRVKRVGTWDDVRSRIERGVYQPTLLFYERKGIEQKTLEKFATEIHQWWKESAEASEKKQEEQDKTEENQEQQQEQQEQQAQQQEQVSPLKHDAVLAQNGHAKPQSLPSPSVKAPPTTNSLLPMSPIHAPKSQAAPPATDGARSWLEEDFFLMHQSAKDTLSRLNGILSRETKPAVGSGGADLRMSMSMPRSVRRREYSVRRPGDDVEDVDRDTIFRDDLDSPPLGASPTKTSTLPQTLQKLEDIVHAPGSAASVAQAAGVLERVQLHDQKTSADGNEVLLPSKIFDVQLRASDGGLGLVLEQPKDAAASGSGTVLKNGKADFVVQGFEVNGTGDKLAAEASGAIQVGDVLLGINGDILERESLYEVLEKLWTAPNPVTLTFHRFTPWACPRCTLLNDVGTNTCVACGNQVQISRGALVKTNGVAH